MPVEKASVFSKKRCRLKDMTYYQTIKRKNFQSPENSVGYQVFNL
jgi:hypothetical protein